MSFGTPTVTNNLPYIHNYKAAHRHFTKTPYAKTKRRGAPLWDANARPLGDKTRWQYRLEAALQGTEAGPDYYDVCLYQTSMARYYRPAPDGSELRQYVTYSSNLSSCFMHNVVGVGHYVVRATTTEGKTVEVPISYYREGTVLCYTADNTLDVSRSRHDTTYTNVASDDIKVWRKMTKAHLHTLTRLWELMVPTWAPTTTTPFYKHHSYGREAGAAFSKLNNKKGLYRAVELSKYGLNTPVTEPQVQAMLALYRACMEYQHLMPAREYVGEGELPEITPASITKSFFRHLEEALVGVPNWCEYSIPHRTKAKQQPKFMEKLPGKWHF